jgi:hypothetical protein
MCSPKRSLVQRPRPEELCADVESIPGSSDGLTPYDLHVVGKFAAIDHDSNGRNRSDLESPVRFDQASRHTAVEKTHRTLSREHAEL